MGKFLRKQDVHLDAILCSTAVRARATAEGFLQEYTFEGEVQYVDDLYHADPESITYILNQLPEKVDTVMVVSHNPGLDYFLEMACDVYEHMTTACVAYIIYPLEHWVDLRLITKGKLIHFWRPREI
jgi:phosphohistidine phosphatase